MGQKVNPHGLRVGVIKNWDSRWFVKDSEFGDTLVADYKLRKFLKNKLYAAGVPKIEIERDASRVRIHIHCAKPGIVIGKGGAEIEKLRVTCEKMLGTPTLINIVEVKDPYLDAQPRVSKSRCPAVWAVRKLPAASSITREPFPCRRCAPTSTTASLKPTPPTAGSASKRGSTAVRCWPALPNPAGKEAASNAVT